MFSIRSNIAGMGAQRNMGTTASLLDKSMEKLSSGFRINRAGDDAAGLAISEKLKAQVSGLNQAARNSLDGISMIQTAEAGLDEIQNIMHRMRELAVQGSNDTLGNNERKDINAELQQLKDEMVSISSRTKFNGKGLLDGSLATSVDANAAGTTIKATDTFTATQGTVTVSNIDVSQAKMGYTYKMSDATGGKVQMDEYDTAGTATGRTQTVTATAIDQTTPSATLDFAQLGVSIKLTISNTTGDNATASDIAAGLDTENFTTTIPASLQSGANQNETTNISFTNANVTSTSASSTLQSLNTALNGFQTAVGTATGEQGAAETLLGSVDSALDYISQQRATLGAAQNRLEHSIANVKNAAENLAASNSRIRDVDVAEESSNMARSQILMQAGVSVLAQSNQMSQLALKLLG